MSSFNQNSVLTDRDINAHNLTNGGNAQAVDGKQTDVKSMEYHRQVLQSKLEESKGNQTYVSPSDTIMSPCTAKLSAYRSKQVGKAKPKSLFAKASAKSLGSSNGGNLFGKEIPSNSSFGSREMKN